MTAANAPFPTAANPSHNPTFDQLSHPNRAYFVRIEGSVRGLVPSFYVPHANPADTIVKSGGVPLLAEVDGRPFTVDEVPIERRWCIKPDGELIDGMEFTQKIERAWAEFFTQVKVEDPESKVQMGNFNREAVPNVFNYVARQVDPLNPMQFVPMHYNADATSGSRPEYLADRNGEAVDDIPRIERLRRSYADPVLRQRMTRQEQAEVQALGTTAVEISSPTAGDELQAKLDLLKAANLPEEKYAEMVAQLLGVDSPSKPKEGRQARPRKPGATVMTNAPCGKELGPYKTAGYASNAVKGHVKHCEKCQNEEARTEAFENSQEG